ncbi:MAG: mercury resistance system periplasmic binding protein MerP [Parvibaculaceae bacterium]|nr:mercury resistance system periplasmic binding protein MerP [Parvibaculaceae bacterium]
MKSAKKISLAFGFLLLATGAQAADQTVTLSVEGMTCQTCPYQVKSALNSVEGVISVEATLEAREATVTYDDEVTTIASLTDATANAGYPSELKVSTR